MEACHEHNPHSLFIIHCAPDARGRQHPTVPCDLSSARKAGPWHYFHNNMGWRYDVTWELAADSGADTPFGLPGDLLWVEERPGMPRPSSRFTLVLDRLCIARLKAARGADLVGPAPFC